MSFCTRPISRRGLGVATAAAITGRGGRSARAARSLTCAGPGGWFQTAFESIVLASFHKAHPDIDVFYYAVGNSFQALGQLRSERRLPSLDIVLLESSVAIRATVAGLLDPLTPAMAPVLKDLRPEAIMPNAAGPVLVWDSLALGYNPGLTGVAPRTWRDLWNVASGRIALQVPPDPAALALTQVASTLFGGRGDLASLDIGITALTALAPRIALWDPKPDIYTAIAFGDAAIGPGWNAQAQNQGARAPGRYAAVLPEEGSPVIATTVNLVKGSTRTDAAGMLIAWLLGAEAQRLLTEAMFLAPVNAAVDIPTAALAKVGATPAMAARRMAMDWVAMTAMRDQITAEWRRRNISNR